MTDRHTATALLTSLHGRGIECAQLDEMLASVREGQSRTLVVRGEAGVAKTALLEYAVQSASDLRVARAVGVESPDGVAVRGPASGVRTDAHLERLPPPQREALRIVFGLSGGPAPDGFLVGLAVLTLLSDVAEERALLCVVDDVSGGIMLAVCVSVHLDFRSARRRNSAD